MVGLSYVRVRYLSHSSSDGSRQRDKGPRGARLPRIDCRSYGTARDVSSIITGNYNSAVVKGAKAEPSLRPIKDSGRLRERDSDVWFPVEFLTYHDDRNRLRSFAYVSRKDGTEIPDGHYVFLDEIGERSFRWRK